MDTLHLHYYRLMAIPPFISSKDLIQWNSQISWLKRHRIKATIMGWRQKEAWPRPRTGAILNPHRILGQSDGLDLGERKANRDGGITMAMCAETFRHCQELEWLPILQFLTTWGKYQSKIQRPALSRPRASPSVPRSSAMSKKAALCLTFLALFLQWQSQIAILVRFFLILPELSSGVVVVHDLNVHNRITIFF